MGHTIRQQVRRHARRVVVAVAAGTMLVAGVGAAAPSTASTTQQQVLPDVDLDVALLGKLAALKYCATSSFASNPDGVRVLYGVRQLSTLTTTSRVFVLRNSAGKFLLCDMFGRDRPSVLPVPQTSASRPAVFFSSGQRRWSCDGTTLRSFKMTNWLRVQDPIKSARVRYTVNGVEGPWFTAARQGSFVHLQSWMGSALGTDLLKVELQLLDRNGAPVQVQGIPSGPRKLDGCGTNVVIG